ncbi:MAG TPA: hypothetical protein VGM05_16220 [Planctomycetaceae bacterium]
MTTSPVPAGNKETARPGRGRLRLVNVGAVVMLLSTAGWLRCELLTIDRIDVDTVCRESEELTNEYALPAKPGQEPQMSYSGRKHDCRFTYEFAECRDRFAGLIIEPKRRTMCFDAARDDGLRSCKAQLAELSDRFGDARVRRALQWRYGSPEQIAKFYFSKICEFAAIVIGPALGVVFILVTAKSINRCATPALHRSVHEFRTGDN